MDSLDVFVYVDGRLEKMASFCGSERPKPIMSNGPKLSVEFRGLYSSRHSRGFKIFYSFVEGKLHFFSFELTQMDSNVFLVTFCFNKNIVQSTNAT